MGLQPDDPRQPYVQIADGLREAMRTGEYAPGEKLPTTRELMDEYGVASTTAQRALSVLRAEGLVYSIQGRGTFVRSDVDVSTIGDSSPADVGTLLRRVDELTAEVRQLDERVSDIESAGRGRKRSKSS